MQYIEGERETYFISGEYISSFLKKVRIKKVLYN